MKIARNRSRIKQNHWRAIRAAVEIPSGLSREILYRLHKSKLIFYVTTFIELIRISFPTFPHRGYNIFFSKYSND